MFFDFLTLPPLQQAKIGFPITPHHPSIFNQHVDPPTQQRYIVELYQQKCFFCQIGCFCIVKWTPLKPILKTKVCSKFCLRSTLKIAYVGFGQPLSASWVVFGWSLMLEYCQDVYIIVDFLFVAKFQACALFYSPCTFTNIAKFLLFVFAVLISIPTNPPIGWLLV